MDKLAELSEALVRLDAEEAARLIDESLAAGIPAAQVLADGLSTGMRKIGEQFREGVVYMPEVLVACDIYYSGLEKLRPLIQPGENRQVRGKMILGTIHGDIHTVGKDVAVPVFEAAGYDVIDLGVDVADDRIVEAIREHNPDIVGLGTYMTPTFMHTRETVRAIEAAGLRGQVKIICGGPAVDAGAAKRMGADDASDDAWDAVGKLDRLMDELKAQGRAV